MQIYSKHKGRYGYRRITLTLKIEYGLVINHKTVLKLMRKLGIFSKIRVKKYRSYKGEIGKTAPNILNRNFSTTKVNEKWVTDITEFNVLNNKIYLSTIIDLHSKNIVSYTIGKSPSLNLVLDMTNEAFKDKNLRGLIMHSDQGWHYQHIKYTNKLKELGIIQSMSRKGNCLDNSLAENFFSHLKSEFFYLESFDSIDDFIKKLNEYMSYYNSERISCKLKGMTPIQFRNHSLAA